MHDAEDLDEKSNLRLRAVSQLTAGARTQRTGAVEAMAALLHLASSPATARDALALVHELQVHQVELDMQFEELQNSRDELETALTRQACLFERAPAGYLSMDAATLVHEVNIAGERLLGVKRAQLVGRPFDRLLTQHGCEQLESLVCLARNGLAPKTCQLQFLSKDGFGQSLLANVSRDLVTGRYLMVLMEPLSST